MMMMMMGRVFKVLKLPPIADDDDGSAADHSRSRDEHRHGNDGRYNHRIHCRFDHVNGGNDTVATHISAREVLSDNGTLHHNDDVSVFGNGIKGRNRDRANREINCFMVPRRRVGCRGSACGGFAAG
jgi:hypothetical protein